MQKLIILDRDGVINFDSPEYIKSPDEWQPIPGSLEAIAKLHQAGYKIAVATNQAAIGRGLIDFKILSSIHEKMLNAARDKGGEIAAIFFCPHHPDDRCSCRKPQPGLLYQIRDYFEVNLESVIMVGDSQRDLEAAYAAGAMPVLVRTGNGMAIANKTLPFKFQVFNDLLNFSNSLL